MSDQAQEPVAWIGRDHHNNLTELYTRQVQDSVPLYLAPPNAEQDEPFKAAVLDALTINWALKAEHETDARLAVADLVAQETAIALDPAVSSDAQALIDKGRAEERERCAEHDALISSLARQTARLAEEVTNSDTLRAALDKYGDGMDWIQRAMQADAENERLRELVREALAIWRGSPGQDWDERAEKVLATPEVAPR